VQLGDILLQIAFAELAQRRQLFGAQRGERCISHPVTMALSRHATSLIGIRDQAGANSAGRVSRCVKTTSTMHSYSAVKRAQYLNAGSRYRAGRISLFRLSSPRWTYLQIWFAEADPTVGADAGRRQACLETTRASLSSSYCIQSSHPITASSSHCIIIELEDTGMSKEQKGNRESKKPKKEKIKTIAAAPSQKTAGWQPTFGSGKKK
jgi:hypothetical protein